MTARQRWARLGHVYNAAGNAPWLVSHASYPTPLPLASGEVRVYFSPRDAENRSCIAALDLALEGERFAVTAEPDAPVLAPGERGAFDDNGVTVGCVIPDGDRLLAYYLGWSLSVTVPFRNFIGLAVGSRAGGAFERISVAPIVDRSAVDPYTLSYPWVLSEKAGWRMWYGSHLCWGLQRTTVRHVIKQAQSADGRSWRRDGRIAIGLAGDAEFSVSRPCVLRDPDCYRMWYGRRTPRYSLGYAESPDGEAWVRADDALVLTGSAAEWESEMIEYAAVFDHGGHRYMLYNGNGYGRTGFGLAILER